MFKNYLKIAFRKLRKDKVYSGINIFGLAVGIACCLLLALYLVNEFSFDKFHSKSDRIYRAWVHEDYGDGDIYWNTTTPFVLKTAMDESIPEAELIVRRFTYFNEVKTSERAESVSGGVTFVDPGFFDLFDFKPLRGDAGQTLTQPSEVVLSKSAALKFFGTSDAIGKEILIKMGEAFETFRVSAIVEDAPDNSSIQYEMIMSMERARTLFSEATFTRWFTVTPETYVLLNEGSDPKVTEEKLIGMMKQELGESYSESNYKVGLQPVTDIHLNTEVPVGIAPVRDPMSLYILSGIALIILLIACANFITLSISRSTVRAKEVGIRKTAGANRGLIMKQFFGESLLMTAIALLCGVLLAELLLPFFNELTRTSLDLSFTLQVVWIALGLLIFVGLIAGSYPALILSSFKPAEVLKGKVSVQGGNSFFRTGMVVFQFSLSIFLIIATLGINKQLKYMQNKDLGYDKEQVLILQTSDLPSRDKGFSGLIDDVNRKAELLRNVIGNREDIKSISASIYTPAQSNWINADYRDREGKKHMFNINYVEPNYLDLMSVRLEEGRGFNENISSDSKTAIIINRAFANEHGWENPLEQQIPGPNFPEHQIIGVTENFNYAPLRTEVEPLALAVSPMVLFSGVDNIGLSPPAPRISIKIASSDYGQTLAGIENAWSEITPGEPFEYRFLDQSLNDLYQQEQHLRKIVSFASVVAILIACLGLFGLASLMVSRRTREIGIRKVLGASASGILVLLNKRFSLLILTAFLLAAPAAWYALNQWMLQFAYKSMPGLGLFFMAGLGTLIIGWLTVSGQSLKTALTKPVESLRSE